MAGLLIFARVDQRCAGPGCSEGPIPVELDPNSTVEDIVVELHTIGAVRSSAGVEVEWQGARLKRSDHLPDVGLGSQSTVLVVLRSSGQSRIAGGTEHSAAVLNGQKQPSQVV
eukprot:Hpha_TRINITY_DN7496_c0_g1::TRINITY_DN7496_c0_g1_i1::g.95997::m.95997